MNQIFIEDQKFAKIDYKVKTLEKGEYENCTFTDCDFSNTDLSDIIFSECGFITCNLSLIKLSNTAFRNIAFKGCKMLGLYFDHCNEFGLSFGFDTCILNHSSFYKAKIKKTLFVNSQLQEVDFTECDLAGALFDNCDLTRATFVKTNLEKCDFRTSFHYSLDPEMNRIKKAKFSVQGVAGLLNKYDIEIDETV
jgi:uncharacterized protein YjbI with pentapeptide repeats